MGLLRRATEATERGAKGREAGGGGAKGREAGKMREMG
jgi:hypothetical protein